MGYQTAPASPQSLTCLVALNVNLCGMDSAAGLEKIGSHILQVSIVIVAYGNLKTNLNCASDS